MARKVRKVTSSEVVGRVARLLIDAALTADEIGALERIETRRQEADAELRRAITPEQKTRAYAKGAKAGEEALALMERVRVRRELNWSALALKEFDALAALRGEDWLETQSGARVMKSPLMRLKDARLISEEQAGAGVMYGLTWQRLYGAPRGQGGGSGCLDPLDSRAADLRRLDAARGYSIPEGGDGRVLVASGLGGDARLIGLCDRICGQEMSLREAIGTSAHKRKAAMERFRYALGLLALHYGLLKTRESEQMAA